MTFFVLNTKQCDEVTRRNCVKVTGDRELKPAAMLGWAVHIFSCA